MENFKIKFLDWINLKIQINTSNVTNDYFKEGQIWWVSLGHNIGSEENGKNKKFERPVLILKRINKETFWALPTSTQIQKNKYRYIFNKGDKQYSIKLAQIRLISSKRLIRFIHDIKKDDFKNIKNQLRNLI